MTDPHAPDDLERRLRSALDQRATLDDDSPAVHGDLDAGLDDLGARIGRPADAPSTTSADGAIAGPPRSPGETVIPLLAPSDQHDRRGRVRLATAACIVAVLAIGAVTLATTIRDHRSAPLAVSTSEVPTSQPGGSDTLTVSVSEGPFAGMTAEVGPVPIAVREGAANVPVAVTLVNPTDAAIEGPGCPFASSRFGLAIGAAAQPERWQEAIGSCAVSRSRFEPGSRTPLTWTVDLFAAQGRDDTEYRIVIEADDDALHLEVPVQFDHGPRTSEATPTTAPSKPTNPVPTGPEGGSTGDPCPRAEQDVLRYVGRTEASARTSAAEQGRTVRVVRVDGRSLAVTHDLRCDRLDLTLVDGIVTDVHLG